MNLTEAQKGYLAGIIDADGCISISRAYALEIRVTQSGRVLLDSLQAMTSLGTVHLYNRAGTHNNRYDAFYWAVFSRGAEAILREIHDFLIVKKPQATLALEYRQMKGDGRKGGLNDALVQRRESYRRALMALKNQRE